MTIVDDERDDVAEQHPDPVDARVAEHLGAECRARPARLVGPLRTRPPLRLLCFRPAGCRCRCSNRPVVERATRSGRAAGRRPRGGPRAPRARAPRRSRSACSIGFESGRATSSASQARRGIRRPKRVRLIRCTRMPRRVARFLREVEWRTCSNFGCWKAGSTPANSNSRRSVGIRSSRRSRWSSTRICSLVEVREEALELHEVLAAGHVRGVRVHQRRPQVALLAALRVVVDEVGGDPLDRVANDVDEPDVGHDLGDPLGHAEVLRVGGVVGRRLAAAAGGRVEVARVPLETARVVALGDEEVELLRRRHRDLRMEAQVVVQAARPALLGADDDQVRQREIARPGTGSRTGERLVGAVPPVTAAVSVGAGASIGAPEGTAGRGHDPPPAPGPGASARPSRSSPCSPIETARSGLRPASSSRTRAPEVVGAGERATAGLAARAAAARTRRRAPQLARTPSRVGEDEDPLRRQLADRRAEPLGRARRRGRRGRGPRGRASGARGGGRDRGRRARRRAAATGRRGGSRARSQRLKRPRSRTAGAGRSPASIRTTSSAASPAPLPGNDALAAGARARPRAPGRRARRGAPRAPGRRRRRPPGRRPPRPPSGPGRPDRRCCATSARTGSGPRRRSARGRRCSRRPRPRGRRPRSSGSSGRSRRARRPRRGPRARRRGSSAAPRPGGPGPRSAPRACGRRRGRPRRPARASTSAVRRAGSSPSSRGGRSRGSSSSRSRKTIGRTRLASRRRPTVGPASAVSASSPGSRTASKAPARRSGARRAAGPPHRPPAPDRRRRAAGAQQVGQRPVGMDAVEDDEIGLALGEDLLEHRPRRRFQARSVPEAGPPVGREVVDVPALGRDDRARRRRA